MNFVKALLDPTSVFKRPDDVLKEDSLSRLQKIEILKRWEYDARNLEVAEEENMAGGPPDALGDVLRALDALDADLSGESSPPNKQG